MYKCINVYLYINKVIKMTGRKSFHLKMDKETWEDLRFLKELSGENCTKIINSLIQEEIKDKKEKNPGAYQAFKRFHIAYQAHKKYKDDKTTN